MKFRKKPVVIEAEQWFPRESDRDNLGLRIGVFFLSMDEGRIDTLEGPHKVTPGDWIITGIKGEKYPCKPDIFEATYEKIE
jgi:hypothetical protein